MPRFVYRVLLGLAVNRALGVGPLALTQPNYTPATIARDLASVGDDDMAPLMESWLAAFQKIHPAVKKGTRWEHLTSATAVTALALEIADVAPIAREPGPAEVTR